MNSASKLRLIAFGAMLVATAGGVVAAESWKPTGNVEIVSVVAAGGAIDKVNRIAEKIWQEQKIVEAPMAVVNKPGGGGVIGWTYLAQHPGDGNLVSINSASLLTNKIVGSSPYTYSDLTTVAFLYNEYIAAVVAADSPIKDGRDLVDRLKQDPQALSIGIASARGNHIHAGIALPLKAGGVDITKLKTVVFPSGGEALTNLLGGHVDVVSTTLANAKGLIEAGKLRIVAITAPERLGGAMAQVPTWKEQGVDTTFSAVVLAVAPPGLDAAQIAFWEDAFKQLNDSPEWQQSLADNFWVADFRGSADAVKYLDEQAADLRSVMTDLGLAK